jgi:hypothetical protein
VAGAGAGLYLSGEDYRLTQPLNIGAGMDVMFRGSCRNESTINMTGGVVRFWGEFVNAGTMQFGPDAQVNCVDPIRQTAGRLILNGATVDVWTPGASLIFDGGALLGSGTIQGSVDNRGAVVSPGVDAGSAGLITVTGNFAQSARGELDIDIGGAAAGSEHDRLAVGGNLALGGTLRARYIGGYTPASGTFFDAVTFGGERIARVIVDLEQATRPPLRLAYTASTLRLTVRAGVLPIDQVIRMVEDDVAADLDLPGEVIN